MLRGCLQPSLGTELDLELVGELDAVQEGAEEDWTFLHGQVPVLVHVRVVPQGWEVLIQVVLLFLTFKSEMGTNHLSASSSHACFVQVELSGWGTVHSRLQGVLIDQRPH
jgi:hypothetical protein